MKKEIKRIVSVGLFMMALTSINTNASWSELSEKCVQDIKDAVVSLYAIGEWPDDPSIKNQFWLSKSVDQESKKVFSVNIMDGKGQATGSYALVEFASWSPVKDCNVAGIKMGNQD